MYIRVKIFLGLSLMFIYLLLSIVGSLSAAENGVLREPRFKSVRAMGMGNAFSAIANDGDAFYYNPAGLASITYTRFDIQPVRFIPSEDLYDQFRGLDELLDDLDAISASDSPLEDPNLEQSRLRLMHRLESLATDDFWLDVGVPVRAIVPFHIGDLSVSVGAASHAWSMSHIAVQRRGLDWENFVMDALDDDLLYKETLEVSYGAAAAVELPMNKFPMELSLGLFARRIRRWRATDEDDMLGFEDIINPYGMDGIEGTEDDFRERYFDPDDPWDSVITGEGYSVDVGSIATFKDALNMAVVIQNLVGNVEYDEGEDDDLPLNFVGSAALDLTKLAFPDIPALDIIVAAEVDEIDKGRLGLEVIWYLPSVALSARVGSNYGFTTLGAGIQFALLDFDYAFYADDDADWHAFSLNLAF